MCFEDSVNVLKDKFAVAVEFATLFLIVNVNKFCVQSLAVIAFTSSVAELMSTVIPLFALQSIEFAKVALPFITFIDFTTAPFAA